MRHVLLAVSGPSGVGKGTMVKTLISRRPDVVESVSCTTRAPREGEIHGKHYFFLSREEFERRIAEDDFLVQEFNREANTTCSKSNDVTITRAGLALKNEIEKIREQVQNLE